MAEETIKLTQYSRGAGCGCKIAPGVLEEILKTTHTDIPDKNLLVGNAGNDDAAVYDLGNGQALISSTDFFMPVVDDAFDFGRIAAANAISDIYAMGGRPLLAIAILGWPVEKLPAALAQKVLDGARNICTEAGIILAGGHSIDNAEPIFGLSVNGLTDIGKIKRNDTAKEGDWLFLTKPIGTGILSTAQKRNLIKAEHAAVMVEQMASLNKVGMQLAACKHVTAMTDITGFGLLGHSIEMAAARLSAEIYYNRLPVMEGVREYLQQRIVPDATYRNWNAYSSQVGFEKNVNVMEAFNLLPDPQTNGGILFSVKEEGLDEIKKILAENNLAAFSQPIGRFSRREDKTILVKQEPAN